MLGRRQVVRHKVLVLAFAGSNPAAPANSLTLPLFSEFGPFVSVKFPAVNLTLGRGWCYALSGGH